MEADLVVLVAIMEVTVVTTRATTRVVDMEEMVMTAMVMVR